MRFERSAMLPALLAVALIASPAIAGNAYREKGKAVAVSDTPLLVTPARDWNRLGISAGKRTEIWTLDGEDLNDVTFFAGIEPEKPLVRETDRKHKPLPRFTKETLLAELPELLEGTYRASKGLATFTVSGAAPERFLGQEGIRFTFEYVDEDDLRRKGEARATIVKGLLYMATFTAPTLHYYDRTLTDFRALADSAKLQ